MRHLALLLGDQPGFDNVALMARNVARLTVTERRATREPADRIVDTIPQL